MRFSFWLVVFCLSSLPFSLMAQLPDINAQMRWGPTERAPNNSYLAKVVDAGRWGAYCLRRKPATVFRAADIWLERYDPNYQLLTRNELTLPDEAQLEDVVRLRQQLYVLYHRPQQAQSQVWIRPLSANATLIADPRLLAEVPLHEQFRDRQFDLEFNRDSSYLLLYNQYPPQRGGPERFALRVFDDRFELIWEKEVELPYPDRDFSVREYRVDPDGNVYLLARYAPLEADGKRAPASYLILAYTRGGEIQTTYRVELEDVWVRELSFRLAGNGDLVGAGFYQAKANQNDIGVCHVRINPLTKEVHTIHLPSLWTPEMGDALASQNFRLREMALRSDGGVVITAEQFTRSQRTGFTYDGPAPLNFFSYQDILLINLAPDGTFTWIRRIPKLQTSVNDGGAFSSFAQATIADRFYFLYNDSEKRFQTDQRRSNDSEYLEPERSVLTITEVNRQGDSNTKPLLLHADRDVVTMPRWCRQIGPRQLLLYGVSGRDYALGIVEF